MSAPALKKYSIIHSMHNYWKSQFPSLSLSLPEETDEPGALASEGYSPIAFLVGVSSHLQQFNVCQELSSKLFSLACRKFSSRAADTIRNALMAFTFPIPVKSPNADPTSVSGPDPFISVPIHPRKDMIMCIAHGLGHKEVSQFNTGYARPHYTHKKPTDPWFSSEATTQTRSSELIKLLHDHGFIVSYD